MSPAEHLTRKCINTDGLHLMQQDCDMGKVLKAAVSGKKFKNHAMKV